MLAGLARELTSTAPLTGEGVSAVLISVALLLAGALTLVPDDVAGADGNGLVLAGFGALYVALGAGAFVRQGKRDLSTLLWALGLGVGAVGEGLLFSGTWLVLAYTLSAAAQVALLRVLENQEVLRVGSTRPVPIKVNVLQGSPIGTPAITKDWMSGTISNYIILCLNNRISYRTSLIKFEPGMPCWHLPL